MDSDPEGVVCDEEAEGRRKPYACGNAAIKDFQDEELSNCVQSPGMK